MLFDVKHFIRPKKTNQHSDIRILKIKPIILAFIIILSTITTLPLIQSTSVSALSISESDPNTFDQQIRSILYYNAISYCFANSVLSTSDLWNQSYTGQKITRANAVSGNWFSSTEYPSNLVTQTTIGLYMKNVVGGHSTCNNSSLISGAAQLWNTTPIALLCASNFKRDDAENNCESDPAGQTIMSNYVMRGSTSQTIAAFTNFVKSNVYGGSDIKDLTSAQLYIYYLHTLSQGCIPNLDTNNISPSNTDYGSNNGKTGVMNVTIADTFTDPKEAKTSTGSYGLSQNSSDTNPVGVMITAALVPSLYAAAKAYNYISSKGSTCSDIAAEMSKHAQDYVNVYNQYKAKNPGSQVQSGTGTDNSNNTSSSTKCSIDGVGWIVCPIVNFLAGIADGAFVFLSNNFLSTSTLIFTKPSTNSDGKSVVPTLEAWSAMRNIANIAFVIAFMVIIFSQLTSYGIDNYGIKKILPRLIIAAILVNISYYICQIAVDISNILGFSLKGFLAGLAPKATIHPGFGSEGSWVGIVGGVLVAGATAWASLAILIPALLAAIVSLVMILFLLTARQALIILLIVISPLAFVAFLLPNTNDWYKKWQKAFLGMLMLFPIVSLVFGASTLASSILSSVFDTASTSDSPTLGKIVAAVVLVVPLFIVPSLLKKSLDGVGGIGAKLNGIGDKLGGALGKKGSEWYDNTPVARGRAERKQYRQSYRDQRYAENLSKGGLTKSLAKGLRGRFSPLAADKFANERLDSYAAANANDLDEKAVNNKFAQMRRDLGPGNLNGAQSSLIQAIEEGDSVSARAAMRLLKVNNTGRNLMAEAIQGAKVTEKNEKTLSNMKSEALTYGLKGQNILLDKWASNATYDVKDANGNVVKDANGKNVKESYATINDIPAGENIFDGLNDTELAGQSEKLVASNESNFRKVVNRDTANRILSNANLVKDMNPKNRALLEQIAKKSGVGRGPSDGSSGGFIL